MPGAIGPPTQRGAERAALDQIRLNSPTPGYGLWPCGYFADCAAGRPEEAARPPRLILRSLLPSRRSACRPGSVSKGFLSCAFSPKEPLTCENDSRQFSLSRGCSRALTELWRNWRVVGLHS
jgi:hypothetical protein